MIKTLNKQISKVRRAIGMLQFSLDYVITGKYDIIIGRKTRQRRSKNGFDLARLIEELDAPRRKRKPKYFISSPEWRRLRLEVFNIFPMICMKCGSENNINVDHIKPRSKYPQLAMDINNLQVLCWGCNKAKSNKDETDYRKKGK